MTKINSQATRKRRHRSQPTERSTVFSNRMLESDGSYFFKLVVVLLLGTFWIKFNTPVTWLGMQFAAIPLGIAIGVILVKLFEKSMTNRKIWYAVLLVVGVISYFVPAGVII